MNKVCIIFLLSIIISLTAVGFCGNPMQSGEAQTASQEYLRIHIRADSNENAAQSVKYQVRDEVVALLTPIVAECSTREQAIQRVGLAVDEVAQIATKTLREKGFSYAATAELTVEYFPTRVYEDCLLPAGEYAALVVRLGRGEGDNWWCVVYPPLCFTAVNTNVVYKSKIAEIIKAWKNDKE